MMDLQTSIKTCFKKFANFDGRASRSEYWWFQLFYIVIIIVAALFDSFYVDNSQTMGPVELVSTLVLFIPASSVGVRRHHDVGRSGWWWLASITIIGLIPLLIWTVSIGTKNKNRFGPAIKLKR